MKPLWKVKGFEKQTYQPQQTRKDTRTDRRKVTVMHQISKRTVAGTGTATVTARRGTAQDSTAHDSTGERSRQGDEETTLTFRALHGNHIVSIPFETIEKKTEHRDVEDLILKFLHPNYKEPTTSDKQTDRQTDSQTCVHLPRHAMCFSSILFSHILDSCVFQSFLFFPGTIERFYTYARTTNVELPKQVKN